MLNNHLPMRAHLSLVRSGLLLLQATRKVAKVPRDSSSLFDGQNELGTGLVIAHLTWQIGDQLRWSVGLFGKINLGGDGPFLSPEPTASNLQVPSKFKLLLEVTGLPIFFILGASNIGAVLDRCRLMNSTRSRPLPSLLDLKQALPRGN